VVSLEAHVIRGPKALRQNARAIAGVLLFSCAALLQGCASFTPQTKLLAQSRPAGVPGAHELTEVPFFAQSDYQCGPASLAMAMVAAGVKTTPDELVPEVYLPERKGSLQVEMLAAPRRHGLVSYQLAPSYADLIREIAAGTPVIVLQNLGIKEGWHYAVAVGYDWDNGMLQLRSGLNERQELPFAMNEMAWRRSGYWAMVAVPPERIPASADEQRWLAAIAALERAGQSSAARTAYRTFLVRWPANVNAAIGLANAHHALGELTEAERVLREAAKQAPDSVVVLNNLAQVLADQGRYREALPYVERAAATGGPHADAVSQTRKAILQKLSRGN
jgi:tetratricopeptide (TPR) repeat protein